jgi:putative hydroxymethylpyrimidine transporter CytX
MGLGGPLVVVRQWLEKAGIWIVLATAAWMAIYLVTTFDLGAALARPGDGSLTFAQAIDLVVVMPISWLPLVADYNRFARTTRSAFWGTVSGFAVANIGFYALGVLLILVLPDSDLIGSILAIAFGAAGLALLLGDEADNAFADIYSAAISIRNVRPGWSTRWLVVGIGTIVLAIALTVDLTQYQSFLYLVGALFTPLFGVLFADYFLLRRRAYHAAELYPDGPAADHLVSPSADHAVGPAGGHPVAPAAGRPSGVNLVALIAWGAGIGSYLLVINLAPALGGTLPSLGVSTVAYVILTRFGRARPG